jgi:HNH endonuclease
MPKEKRCWKCGETKPTSEFFRNRSRWDGLCDECKACRAARFREYRQKNRAKLDAYNSAYSKTWYLANRERHKAVRDAYYEANKEKVIAKQRERRMANPEPYRAYQAEYEQKNREKIRERKAQWRRDHPEEAAARTRARNQRRRARINAVPAEEVDYGRILKQHGSVCHICGRPIRKMTGRSPESLSFDHVVPLLHGGPHLEENIRPAHFGCNSRKSTKLHFTTR